MSAAAFGASLHDFTMNDIKGKATPLASYKGKAVLVVNVASQCGYTPQYAGLQSLYEKYKDKGLVIAGFPANNFGAQEPGTNDEIKTFCERNYKVTFPMFSKISVTGSDQAPLYKYLTDSGGKVSWNFTKFLVGPDGQVVGRYASTTKPEKIAADIEKLLPA